MAVELEALAKKYDRFGWDRDRGSFAHDRMITDWMDALQDFPLNEVQAACRQWVLDNPRRMPNEGDIRTRIMAERASMVRRQEEPNVRPVERVSRERAAEIMAEAGFAPRRFGGDA